MKSTSSITTFDFRRKALIVAFVGLLLVFGTARTTQHAYASDANTGYGFYLESKGSTDGTEWRHKAAAGSAYIHIMYHNGHHCRLYIDGALDREGRGSKNCMVGKAYDERDGQYRIRNTVRDSRHGNEDYKWARLTAWAPFGTGSTNGVWSPDCSEAAADLPVLNID